MTGQLRNSRSTATDVAESSPLKLRARPDLVVSPLENRGARTWVVKEPLAMNYVQLCDEEHEVLQMLDGQTSLRQIKEHLEREFFPVRISLFDIGRFLARLHEENLLVVEAFGQEQTLLQRRIQRRRREWLSLAANLLAIRFPGVNPDPLLDRLYPLVRWMFSRWALLAGLLVICLALIWAAVHLDAVAAELPTLAEYVAPANLFRLALALMVAKGLHELAHGLTCKHFGGTCHELGVMLLAFTPCLYCNVSDAWTFPNKWHRIAVSLAGIYVELLLAAVCTLLWWTSEPGNLHWICLDLMFVCCISTVLINGNPLLKYDGYYVLSDLLRVPNLRQQANQVVEQIAARLLWGIEMHSPRALPLRGRWFLAAYWPAAVAFRCLVLVGILWTINEVMMTHDLESVAQWLTAAVVSGIVITAAWGLWSFSKRAQSRGGNRLRAAVVGSGLTLLASCVLLIPWPKSVTATALLWPAGAQNVYVAVPGQLTQHLLIGERVEQGQVIAKLVNLETEQELQRLQARCDLQRLHVRHLELRRTHDPAAGNELPTAREMLADLEAQLAQWQHDRQRLTVVSPASGIILPPPYAPGDMTAKKELARWHGRAFDVQNEGAFLDTGALLCHVGDTSRMEALLVIDETARQQVRLGQAVRISAAAFGTDALTGKIAEIARADSRPGDSTDTIGREPLTSLDAKTALQQNVYFARVALQEGDSSALCGVSGKARILTEPQSLWRRSLDYLNHTFRYRL